MRSERVRVDTKPKGHFFCKKRKTHREKTHTEKKPHDYGAGDCSDAATSQGMLEWLEPPETGLGKEGILYSPQKEHGLKDTLISDI